MTRLNPIADGMCTLKNAGDTGKSVCVIEPASKLLGAMLRCQSGAQLFKGVMESRLDRAFGDTGLGRDLRNGQVPAEAQPQHDLLIGL